MRGSSEALVPDGRNLLLHVLVVPRASRSALAGLHDGRLKVRIAAPPVDGAANQELLRFLARELGVARSQLALVQGAASKRKTVEIAGLGEADLRARLGWA